MREPRSDTTQPTVEEGLQQLQELGYLHSAGERLVARLVPRRSESFRIAFFASAWLGAGGGAFVAIVLWATALLAEPELLQRPRESLWLLFDLSLIGANLGLLLIFVLVWPLLHWLKRHGDASTERVQQVAAFIPGTLIALYLVDAIGRHFLPGIAGSIWPGAIVAAALAGAVGAALTILLTTLLAVARLRLKGRWRLGRFGVRHRWIPLLLNSAAALLLLGLGPYAAMQPRPKLGELAPPRTTEMRRPRLIIALESLPISELRNGDGPPTLARLAAAARLDCRVSGEQAASTFWSGIATGFGPEEHGLRGVSRAAPRGMDGDIHALENNPTLAAVTRHILPGAGLATLHAADRRELQRPTFWEIAAHAGRRLLVVNWWASYPALRHPRLRIASDRWMLRLWEGRVFAAEDSTLRAPENIAPTLGLRGDLLQHVFRFRAQRRTVIAGDSLLARSVLPELQGLPSIADTWSYATTADALHTLLALRGLEAREFDAVVLQLNGLDILERRLLAALDARPEDARLDENARRLRQIYLRFLEELWQTLASAHDGDWTVLVAESHPADHDRALWSWQSDAADPASAGTPAGWAAILLHGLGVPPARDMQLPAAWAEGLDSMPATYGGRPDWAPPATRHSMDLDRLRGLGYIGD